MRWRARDDAGAADQRADARADLRRRGVAGRVGRRTGGGAGARERRRAGADRRARLRAVGALAHRKARRAARGVSRGDDLGARHRQRRAGTRLRLLATVRPDRAGGRCAGAAAARRARPPHRRAAPAVLPLRQPDAAFAAGGDARGLRRCRMVRAARAGGRRPLAGHRRHRRVRIADVRPAPRTGPARRGGADAAPVHR